MRESVTVTMKSGRKHILHNYSDESFDELVKDVLGSDKFYISGDIVLQVSEIESIEDTEEDLEESLAVDFELKISNNKGRPIWYLNEKEQKIKFYNNQYLMIDLGIEANKLTEEASKR